MRKRVKIPVRGAKELLDLAKKVREKHMADGDLSPLKPLDWAEFGPMIDEALATEDDAPKLRRQMLSAYKHRSRRLQAILGMVRKSRDILTGVYDNDNMRELGHWGFDVVEPSPSPLPDEAPSSTVASQ